MRLLEWRVRGEGCVFRNHGTQPFCSPRHLPLDDSAGGGDSTIACMSRFSKIGPRRFPVPSTATSTMARATSSARITWFFWSFVATFTLDSESLETTRLSLS
jgi:hypothetical protein